jgi:hypothetical protein
VQSLKVSCSDTVRSRLSVANACRRDAAGLCTGTGGRIAHNLSAIACAVSQIEFDLIECHVTDLAIKQGFLARRKQRLQSFERSAARAPRVASALRDTALVVEIVDELAGIRDWLPRRGALLR